MSKILTLLITSSVAASAAKPLQAYILAGQSNMQGHAKISTFEHIGMDPATKPMLEEMMAADGKPKVCDGADGQADSGLRRDGGKDRAGVHNRPLHAEDGGRADSAHRDFGGNGQAIKGNGCWLKMNHFVPSWSSVRRVRASNASSSSN